MTDMPIDTPSMSVDYCPSCEPERDPLREILVTKWCFRHALGEEGLDDSIVTLPHASGGASEAESGACRAAANLIHRKGVTP